jgi:hypothetical protein
MKGKYSKKIGGADTDDSSDDEASLMASVNHQIAIYNRMPLEDLAFLSRQTNWFNGLHPLVREAIRKRLSSFASGGAKPKMTADKKVRKPSKWVEYVKNFAKVNNISYKDALSNKACKDGYNKIKK